MLKNCTAYRILQMFFDSPTRRFQLREISRKARLGLPSVRNHVRMLEREGFVKRNTEGTYPCYTASGSDRFRLYRRNDAIIRLHESGLLEFLADEFVPDAIVLFGSVSRGEDIETSDIDLFLVAREKEVDLKKFEDKLKRKISLHFGERPSRLPNELLNNIINGIVVYGYLGVFA